MKENTSLTMEEAFSGNSHSLHFRLHRFAKWHLLSVVMTPVRLQRDTEVLFDAHCQPGSLAMKVMVNACSPTVAMQKESKSIKHH